MAEFNGSTGGPPPGSKLLGTNGSLQSTATGVAFQFTVSWSSICAHLQPIPVSRMNLSTDESLDRPTLALAPVHAGPEPEPSSGNSWGMVVPKMVRPSLPSAVTVQAAAVETTTLEPAPDPPLMRALAALSVRAKLLLSRAAAGGA